MFGKAIVLILAIAVVLLLVRGAAQPGASQAAEKDAISVSSTAKVSSAPDKAELYANIETVDKDAQKSQQQNSELSDKVIKSLLLEGIARKDIETSQYYLNQKIRYGREGEQIFEGYETVHVLKITATETAAVGNLIDAAVSSGANGISSIIFTLTDEKQAELRNEALGKAAAEAKAKAGKIAESLGVRLGKLNAASESSFDIRPYFAPLAAAEKAAIQTRILPQNVEVTATIAVAYSLD